MLKNPIGWVEIPVQDIDRAEKFYTDFFGFDMKRQSEKRGFIMSWFPMNREEYGSGCMLIQGDGYIPSHGGIVVYFTAPGGTVESALKKAKEMHIRILARKVNVGEYGYTAMIEDSEGNRIGLHSLKG